jgi:putative transposase
MKRCGEALIVLNESHRRRLVRDYIGYDHDDRIHDALQKETPGLRIVERRPRGTAKVVSAPRVGGWHHRYHGQAAA